MASATATDSWIKNVSSIVRGNVGLKIGTWTASAGADAVVVLGGGTAVMAGGANMSSGAADTTAKPVLVDYSFADGNPNMKITPTQTADSGTYWMIVKLS